MRNHSVLARHVKEGEKGTITHSKGEQGSGNFISKGSMGKTAEARIKNGALYPTNRAEEESKVELNSKIKNEKQDGAAKTHNIIIGQPALNLNLIKRLMMELSGQAAPVRLLLTGDMEAVP